MSRCLETGAQCHKHTTRSGSARPEGLQPVLRLSHPKQHCRGPVRKEGWEGERQRQRGVKSGSRRVGTCTQGPAEREVHCCALASEEKHSTGKETDVYIMSHPSLTLHAFLPAQLCDREGSQRWALQSSSSPAGSVGTEETLPPSALLLIATPPPKDREREFWA